jgi:Lhr-like helicase
MKAVDATAKELMKTHKYYRLAFRSISTLIAYLDSNTAFKFLQPFCGKRKRERAVCMFSVEKGMHEEQDIQMIGSIMDGMIDYKVEQLKTFLSIKGICDVQSRAFIDYTHSKQGLSIGSFSLDHIR